MKIRKHKNNRTFKVMFQTRIIGRKTRLTPHQSILASGYDASSVLRAFLFGRDRTNISAIVWERHSGFPSLSNSGNAWFIAKTYEYGVAA